MIKVIITTQNGDIEIEKQRIDTPDGRSSAAFDIVVIRAGGVAYAVSEIEFGHAIKPFILEKK